MDGSRIGYRALLGRPDFRALWAAGGLTLAVVPVLLVVLVWTSTQAFSGSASREGIALALAWLGLSATVPTLLAAVVSGTLADRLPRRRLMQAVNGVEIAALLAIVLVLFERPAGSVTLPSGSLSMPIYLVLLFPLWSVVSASATLFRPALNASVPRIVSAGELGRANGALYAFGLGASVIGSLLAPLLLTTSGEVAALSVPLAFLVIAQAFLGQLPAALDERAPAAGHRKFLADLAEGYRYLGRQRGLLQITLAALAINALGAVAFVELGLYVTGSLGIGSPVFLGALYAGASVGAAVGTLAVARLPFELRAGRVLAVLAVLQGSTVLVLAVVRSYPLALLDMFFYGLLPGMATTVFFALLQATVRNEVLGRVLAADEVGSYALVPIGQSIGGALTLAVGVSSTFLIGGVGILLTGIVLAALPGVRRLGFSPSGPGPASPLEAAEAVLPVPGMASPIERFDPEIS